MATSDQPNGSRTQAGAAIKLSKPLNHATPMLPSFAAGRSRHAADRYPVPGVAAGDTARDHERIAQRCRIEGQRRAMAADHARRRTIGLLVAIALVVLGLLMTARSLHVDRIQQERWEQIR